MQIYRHAWLYKSSLTTGGIFQLATTWASTSPINITTGVTGPGGPDLSDWICSAARGSDGFTENGASTSFFCFCPSLWVPLFGLFWGKFEWQANLWVSYGYIPPLARAQPQRCTPKARTAYNQPWTASEQFMHQPKSLFQRQNVRLSNVSRDSGILTGLLNLIARSAS